MAEDTEDELAAAAARSPRRRSLDRDPTAEVTKADLWDVRDKVVEAMVDGFKGVHDRQDKTNGRVNEAHGDLREHGTKIRNLEREVFERPRRVAPAPANASTKAPTDRRITERDVKMLLAGAAALASAVSFLSGRSCRSS